MKNHIILQNAGVNKFPSVTLNGVKVKGSLNVTIHYLRHNSSLMISAIPSLNPHNPAQNTFKRANR
jgi:hypothetical protein